MSQPQNPAPKEPKAPPGSGVGHKGESDSHAAGSGSSTGDPGKARGQPGGKGAPASKQDIFGTPLGEGAIPID
jgi:hypothetical protein